MENRRKRTRVNFRATAEVRAPGLGPVQFDTEDLSLKGVLLKGRLALQAGQKCDLVIRLMDDSQDAPALEMEGKIIRISEEGTAVEFTSLQPETYKHLRKLVLFNATDPEAAENEMGTVAFDPPDR